MRRLYAKSIVVLAALSGCTVSAPVAVITPTGAVLRGVTSASLLGGEFDVAGASLSCHGRYDPSPGQTVSISARCSDGRVGIGRALRDNPHSGSGKIRMNDGSEATFVYGDAAAGL